VQVVRVVVEEKVTVGDHAFQDADGIDDGSDSDPRHFAPADR
jgi:hypothetical protein